MEHHNCHDLLESLSDYVDHDLNAEMCVEIERHLQNCENCRIVIDTLKKTVELYHTTTRRPDVPEDVRERLYMCLGLDEFIQRQDSL